LLFSVTKSNISFKIPVSGDSSENQPESLFRVSSTLLGTATFELAIFTTLLSGGIQ
jgi:hypothetical protein